MNRHVQFRVPGNLLLTGEYAVLGEGGRGIAMAVPVYGTFTARYTGGATPARLDLIYSQKRSVEFSFSFNAAETKGERILRLLLDRADSLGLKEKDLSGWRLTADTSSFYSADADSLDRDKLGLGSSAVFAVGMAALLVFIQQPEFLLTKEIDTIFHSALTVHRGAQAGKGSGYDVAVSTYGGIGDFSGGKTPLYCKVADTLFAGFSLYMPRRSVETSGAAARYLQLDQSERESFRQVSNGITAKGLKLLDWGARMQFIGALQEAGELGRNLGVRIGAPAELDAEEVRLVGGADKYKCVGAGNELALVWGQNPYPGKYPLRCDAAGLTINEIQGNDA